MSYFQQLIRPIALTILLIAIPVAGVTQDLRSTLFSKIDILVKTAKSKKAYVLAPQNYAAGIKAYKQADYYFKKGKNISSIRKELNKTKTYLNKALETTKLAEITFANVIKARNDAYKAGSKKHASEFWKEAEQRFVSATRELESGDIKDAKKMAPKAENLYRRAELSAIKTNYLQETEQLLVQADKMDVDDFAPKTLAKARSLLAKAEHELVRNRYDTDLPRSLARQAKYEAKHAIYLGNILSKVDDDEMTLEELVLDYEKPLIKIAAAVDIVAELDQGHQKPTDDVIGYIEDLKSESDSLRQDIAAIEDKLGGLSSESKILKEREQLRKKAAGIEKLFAREEANVLRKGDEIIIRMIGLNFDVGKSEIRAKNFKILTKLKKAIKIFPESKIVVEGHTDSYGGDAANMTLSQKRAASVRKYIIENMGVANEKVNFVGYGETRPVANNETPEGREKNRRIDIVLNI